MSRIKYRLLQCISFFCPASQWSANLIGQLHLVACAQAVRFPSGSRVRNAPKFPIMATFQAFYYTMKQRKKDSFNTLKTFKAFSLIAFGARNGLHQIWTVLTDTRFKGFFQSDTWKKEIKTLFAGLGRFVLGKTVLSWAWYSRHRVQFLTITKILEYFNNFQSRKVFSRCWEVREFKMWFSFAC